ncbi:Bug family tripartite tricarboxylate transporter substrate binding protein [Hydrogenophaga sp. BPS33]|uniref:Bug family tripartite tricarboxylate transporter substrate binding protein n=1 Tax=Hydrogenophaga sp. BPS33 TaxID=2651974 RepID=UPI00131FFEB9|nr:tripartite tricarboxylate transporter substrate-binding protein [Hydrogenophaga sp. BPS33]QHE85059.1 tripartite tricarboxylate transporter substrate binding protein [Hydrogenophaga sp. BPS33]
MTFDRRTLLSQGMVVLCGHLAPGLARAQSFPTRPLRLVFPAAAGTAGDIATRAIGEKLAERLGQPVVVENKPGGNGIIGLQSALQSPADGHTMFVGYSGVAVVNRYIYRNLSYDMERDFMPVSLAVTVPLALAVNADLNIGTLEELVARAKAEPGKMTYGSVYSYSTTHLAMVSFEQAAGINVRQIPFSLAGNMTSELLAGRLDMAFDTLPTLRAHLSKGRYRLVGVTSKERSALLPDVPSIAESGYPGYQAIIFYGFFVKAGTPPAVVQTLATNIAEILKDPGIRQRLVALGIRPEGSTPSGFSDFLRAEHAFWNPVITKANFPPQ